MEPSFRVNHDKIMSSEEGLMENGGLSSFVYPNIVDFDDDGRPKRTGTFWTASAHMITAVIGSGVLSLGWSVAKLGWIAGPLCLITFALITYYTSMLLAGCYRSPSSISSSTGTMIEKRNYTYMDAVQSILGPRQTKLCALVQYTNLAGTAIGYTITASISIGAIAKSNCFHKLGHHASACKTSTYPYMLLFGGIQVLVSQIPSFSKLWWLSLVATVMSFSYSSIGVGLGIGKVVEEDGHLHGTLGGLLFTSDKFETENIWLIFQSLGNIAFAYSYSMILIEIADTIKSPPSEYKTMKKATLAGVSTTTLFYLLCGCIGYAAFGDNTPGNLLTDFGFYEPYWLLDIANACVVVHLVGGYQVFCQPLFAFVEDWVFISYPKSKAIHKEYKIRVPFYGPQCKLNLFRLVWRTSFVLFTTLASMLLPFFNDILGVVGAMGFWPLTVYFPVEMHIVRHKTQPWSPKWLLLKGLSAFCLLISLAALVGSIQGVLEALMTYKPFLAPS